MKETSLLSFLLFLSLLVSSFPFHKIHSTSSLTGGVDFHKSFSLRIFPKRKHSAVVNSLGKGFGKPVILSQLLSNQLTLTRPGDCRKLEGHYKKIVERHAILFQQLLSQNSESHTVTDIYARTELTSKTWFIGRIIHSNRHRVLDAIKSLEILLIEYAKTLQPLELGKALVTQHPQILFQSHLNGPPVEQNHKDVPRTDLTRYYHFNKETAFFDFSEIGFEPRIYSNAEIIELEDTAGKGKHKAYYFYCFDDGKIMTPEDLLRRNDEKESFEEEITDEFMNKATQDMEESSMKGEDDDENSSTGNEKSDKASLATATARTTKFFEALLQNDAVKRALSGSQTKTKQKKKKEKNISEE
jgi:hypothetical protein